mgnify:FL=1
MDHKKQLEEAISWTKQAGTWVNEHQPSFAKFADPIMLKASANLGYISGVQDFIEATQAPPVIQTALYAAAGAGMVKWNEIVVSEINRGLKEYNSKQTSGNGFNWTKSLLLAGTASLAISNATEDSNSQGIPFSEENVEYITKDFIQEPVNETLRNIIVEPELLEESDDLEDFESNFHEFNIPNLSDIIQEKSPQIDYQDIQRLKDKLELTAQKQSLIDNPLHPKAQPHYDRLSGRDYHRMIEKIERTEENGDLLRAAANKYNIDPEMMFALTIKESDGKVRARSKPGARGLMQIMPRTGKYIAELMGDQFVELTGRSRFRTNDLFDPEINVEMGAFYLRFIHDTYGERILKKRGQRDNGYSEWTDDDVWDFTMACYNRGPSGMTTNMMNARADTFWDLEQGETTEEARRYVPGIRAIEKVYVEYLIKEAKKSNEVARVIN